MRLSNASSGDETQKKRGGTVSPQLDNPSKKPRKATMPETIQSQVSAPSDTIPVIPKMPIIVTIGIIIRKIQRKKIMIIEFRY